MIIDKLFDNVAHKGHVCFGLDTDYSYLPTDFANKFSTLGDGLFAFNKELIENTCDIVACYKVQIAYYEAYGMKGLLAYKKTLAYIKEKGCIAIADVKRGDIAKTAEMYAQAHFSGDFEADFMTLNPYMGLDTISPFLQYVKDKEKGLFVLIRTSNEGAKDIEYLPINENQRVYNVVGEKINQYGKDFLGKCNYSSIGGVMGCTHVSEAIQVRNDLESTFFLIPGYGAQGGKAEDIVLYLKNGNGGVVNASRSLLLAYKKEAYNNVSFAEASRNETIKMRDEILSFV
ncbi:MAG: orotidine-5'-phosphate decarboxylase [Bacteroidales bacterium]|jgi:orotidine-5'-phosphate decarboxylase|nr:orotidine-5'-phosphate decarboxylase [Bacteroidales bacterium]